MNANAALFHYYRPTMPPKGSKIRFDRESSIEHTEEYDEFIKKLTEYHEKRG